MQAAMLESAAEAAAGGERGQGTIDFGFGHTAVVRPDPEQMQRDGAAQPTQLAGAAHILGLEDQTPQWQIQAVEQSRWVQQVEFRRQHGLQVTSEEAELAQAARAALGEPGAAMGADEQGQVHREAAPRERNVEEKRPSEEEVAAVAEESERVQRDRRETDTTFDGENCYYCE